MAQDKKTPAQGASAAPKGAAKPQQGGKGAGAEVAAANKCKFDSCKTKPEKFGFCTAHYEQYMAGVIRGDGKKPVDYEEKLAWYMAQQSKSGARKAA